LIEELRLHRRSVQLLALIVLWASASGAHCMRNPFVMAPNVPQLLPQQPQLGDIAGAVNENTAKVHSIRATQASLAMSDGVMPVSLSAMIAIERPRRFRLKATAPVLGPVADAGSNDELFWFWTKTLHPQAVFFCRHDQFPHSPVRNMVPLEPDWLVEAFGLVTFNPQEQHRGPTPDQQGRLRIDTLRQTQSGPVTKVTLIDARSGWVLEQHLFDAQGKLFVSALTSQHRQDEASGAWLPRKIDLTTQSSGQKMALSIQLAQLEVNTLGEGDYVLWQKPQYQSQGAPDLDLGNPNLRLAPGTMQSSQVIPASGVQPATQQDYGRPRLLRRR
jgi:hypothetical protein